MFLFRTINGRDYFVGLTSTFFLKYLTTPVKTGCVEKMMTFNLFLHQFSVLTTGVIGTVLIFYICDIPKDWPCNEFSNGSLNYVCSKYLVP